MVKEFAERMLKYYRDKYNEEKAIFDNPDTPPLSMRYAGCRMLHYQKIIKHFEEVIEEEENLEEGE